MRVARRVGAVVSCALISSGVTAVSPVASAVSSVASDDPPVATATPYRVPEDEPRATDRSDAAWADPVVTLPPEASFELDVPATGWAQAGTLPVSVARPDSGTPAGRVRVRMLGQGEVAAAGGRLLGFEVTRADGGSAAAYVAVSLDYSGVAKAYGGNFASRLRLVRATGCRPDGPCALPRVAARNEPGVRRLRATSVPVRAESASGPAPDSGFGPQSTEDGAASLLDPTSTTYVAASSASGDAGDYTASSVSGTDRWDVGVGSGAFTYSYPVVVPPAIGGAAPVLSFDYSSQAVDGRTLAANGQAPKTGEGWSFEPGFIERKFESCPSGSNAGEKCWSPKNEYVLHFGGKAGEIVRDAATGEWRLRGDPAWKILERTGGPNSDDNGEYFILITGDGTKHWFGLGAESTVAGAAATGSVQEVPVYGGSGEPCYNPLLSASSCPQAYRWNLDRIVDPNNNVTTFFYGKETNRYARLGNSAYTTSYTRSSYLTRVEYGQRAGSESDSPWARVLVSVADRCLDPADCPAPSPSVGSKYPDVPLDLMCTTTTCATTLRTPTFWSTKKIASVQTEYRSIVPNAPDVWEAVSTYALHYSFPGTGDTTDPSLWLTDITRTGEYGSGSITLPGLRLNGVLLQNRVNTGAGVPPLNKWRVGYVSTDLNARLVVTYDIPHPCPTTPSFSNNGTDCFPAWYDPQDGTTPAGWVSFYKYLVTKVVTEDNRGGQPDRTTTYTYNDTPAWHYDDSLLAPPGTQSWSDYRGHSSVDVSVLGDATNAGTTTRYKLFRGMHGDKITDSTSKSVTLTDSLGTGTNFPDYDYLAGQVLESQRLTSSGTSFEESLHRYWVQQTVNGPDGFQSHDAQYVRESARIDRVKNMNTGAWRDHTTTMEYVGATGVLRKTGTSGDPDKIGDGTCTVHGYAHSDTAWVITAPYRTDTYAGGCATTSPTKIAETDYLYDGQAFMTAPTKGNATQVQQYSSAAVKAVTRTAYDAYGRVTSVFAPTETSTDPKDATTTTYAPSTGFPYDGITTTTPHPTTPGAVGFATTTVLYQAFGTPRYVTDANGYTTTISVDSLGRTTWVVRPGDGGVPAVKFDYLIAPGNPNRITTQRLLSGSSYVTTYDFLDGLGRVVQTQLPPPNDGGAGRRLVTTRYDAAGGKAAESQAFAATGTPGSDLAVVSTSAIPFETRTQYDYAGRAWRTSQYAAGVSQYAVVTNYHGWQHTVHTSVRSDVDYHTDVFGRLSKVVERPATGTSNTSYDYTRLGDLQTITDDAGNVTNYAYDWQRRRTTSTDPDQGTWSTSYNLDGTVATVTDAAPGATVAHTYDRLGRRVATRKDSVTGSLLASWTYDTAANGKGHLASATRHADNLAYTTSVPGYDPRGRPTGKTWAIPAAADTPENAARNELDGTYSFGYAYNPSDALVAVTMPAAGGLPGETVTTELNAAGLAKRVTTSLASGAPYVTATGYRNDGRIASRDLTGGVARSYTYDGTSGRLSTVQATAPLASTGGVPAAVEDLAYAYDDDNNVTSITDNATGAAAQRECFAYDPMNRLTKAFTTTPATACDAAAPSIAGPDPYSLAYTYDDVGDITSATDNVAGTTASYVFGDAAHKHATTAVGANTYQYDKNGATKKRVTAAGTQDLAWDELHQLKSVSGPGASTFVYDADGARLIRQSASAATLYLDGMEITATTSGGATTTAAARYYGGFAMRTPAGVTALLHNHQNSTTTAITSGVVARQRYTPFGARRGAALAATERRFLDKTEDPTGLTAVGARYYDPAIGRFASIDPLVSLPRPQSLAGYSYGLNNPVTLADPSGLSAAPGDGGGSCTLGVDCGVENGSVTAPTPTPTPTPVPTPTPTPPPPATTSSRGGGGIDIGKLFDSACDWLCGPDMRPTLEHADGCADHDKSECAWLWVDLFVTGTSFIPVARAGTAAKEAVEVADIARLSARVAEKEGAGAGLSEAFHYTRSQNVASIESRGLLSGTFATPNGGLSPLQAQIDLALPPNRGLSGSLIRIDLTGLRAAGYEVPSVSQVGRSFNMPGGGLEMRFPYRVPPEFVKVIR